MQRLPRAADDAQASGEIEELRETVDKLEGEVEAMQVSLREAAGELTLREEHAAVREEFVARQKERNMELTAEVERLKLEAEEAAAHELVHKEELKKMCAEQVARQADLIMELTSELELLRSETKEAAVLLADGDAQLRAATALVEEHVLALQEALEETQKEVEVRRDSAQMLMADKERVVAELLTATEALQLSRMQIAELEQVQAHAKARLPQATPNVEAYSNSPTNSSTISHTNSSTNVGNGAAVQENGHEKAGSSGTSS
jgi:chromosome segregation ATPase